MALFASNKALESLHDRLKAIEATCDTLSRENKSLRLEWEELYDKVRHQMSRMSRRVKADAPSPESLDGSSGASEEFAGLDSISRSIMLRRAHQGLKR